MKRGHIISGSLSFPKYHTVAPQVPQFLPSRTPKRDRLHRWRLQQRGATPRQYWIPCKTLLFFWVRNQHEQTFKFLRNMGDVLFSLMENWSKCSQHSLLSWDIPTPRFPSSRGRHHSFGDHLQRFNLYAPMMGGYLNHWQRTME